MQHILCIYLYLPIYNSFLIKIHTRHIMHTQYCISIENIVALCCTKFPSFVTQYIEIFQWYYCNIIQMYNQRDVTNHLTTPLLAASLVSSSVPTILPRPCSGYSLPCSTGRVVADRTVKGLNSERVGGWDSRQTRLRGHKKHLRIYNAHYVIRKHNTHIGNYGLGIQWWMSPFEIALRARGVRCRAASVR